MSTLTVRQGYFNTSPRGKSKLTEADLFERTFYVAGSLLSTVFLLTWQTIQVSKYRKLAGIPYPRRAPLCPVFSENSGYTTNLVL
ncbi:hypothetical protein R3P38DRAFT_2826963 [Favolaschia claudopus]|uniref:Uncharacterized protein n=1 Tax=Favolaschia claudopus TaxID=2862362 RepID=A0AAW0EKT6_9AGAR